MKYKFFVCYSREDKDFIAPIVQVLGLGREGAVFQDIHDIKPGKLWETELLNALDEAKFVVVFWCEHSAKSEYVKKEYELAIEKKKDVTPLLLDNTPTPKALAAYQWIDLRFAKFHSRFETKYITPGDLTDITNKVSPAQIIAGILRKVLNDKISRGEIS